MILTFESYSFDLMEHAVANFGGKEDSQAHEPDFHKIRLTKFVIFTTFQCNLSLNKKHIFPIDFISAETESTLESTAMFFKFHPGVPQYFPFKIFNSGK